MLIKLTKSEIGNIYIISINKQIPTNTVTIATKMVILPVTNLYVN